MVGDKAGQANATGQLVLMLVTHFKNFLKSQMGNLSLKEKIIINYLIESHL